MDYKIVAILIWVAIFFGPPMALGVFAPSFYADANERIGGKGRVNSLWSALIFAVGLIVWAGMLNFIYLPAMGYNLGNPTLFDFGNLQGLRTLWLTTLDWVVGKTPAAVFLLLCPVFAAFVIMALARYLGFTSRDKELREKYYGQVRWKWWM